MNSAFDDNQAGMRPGRCIRRAAGAALACALVLGSGMAVAQQRGDRDFGGQPQQQQTERFRLPQMERDARYDEQRDQHDQRRAQQQQYQQQQQSEAQQDQRRSGRMTADERREMRRQVNEAKDLYPQRH